MGEAQNLRLTSFANQSQARAVQDFMGIERDYDDAWSSNQQGEGADPFSAFEREFVGQDFDADIALDLRAPALELRERDGNTMHGQKHTVQNPLFRQRAGRGTIADLER